MKVSAGLEFPHEGFAQLAGSFFKSTAAMTILFYSALWSIKLSFLLFFRRLGTNVHGQRRLWWPIFGITVATYFACIGTIQYRCLVTSFEYLTANCAAPEATSFQQITLKLNCAWDVITDCLTIIVACLATFRNLFSRENSRHKAESMAAPPSSNLFLRGSGKRIKMRDILDSLVSMPDPTHSSYQRQDENTSEAQSIVNSHKRDVQVPEGV
ncbi:MAG: hypothetical protein Q9216_001984 [Gyalolechia sp. 2 TL-2023]